MLSDESVDTSAQRETCSIYTEEGMPWKGSLSLFLSSPTTSNGTTLESNSTSIIWNSSALTTSCSTSVLARGSSKGMLLLRMFLAVMYELLTRRSTSASTLDMILPPHWVWRCPMDRPMNGPPPEGSERATMPTTSDMPPH